MINYIRHEEEMYMIVKLSSGEQVIGRGFAIEEEGTTLIYISDPVEIEMVTRQVGSNQTVKGVAMNKWINFSDEEFFIIHEKDVITIAGLSQEMVHMYELFLRKSSSKSFDDDVKNSQVEIDSEMGSLGKVDDARKRLEKIYKES